MLKKKKVSFEEALRKWEKEMGPEIEANRKAEQLTAADYAVTINARADDFPIKTTQKGRK